MMGAMTWRDWRSRVLVAVIAVQVAVPLVALVGSEPPTRFGFQMYSGLGWPTVEIRDRDGELLSYNWRRAIASLGRPDLDWGSSDLAARLCTTVPGAATVLVRRNDHESVLACE